MEKEKGLDENSLVSILCYAACGPAMASIPAGNQTSHRSPQWSFSCLSAPHTFHGDIFVPLNSSQSPVWCQTLNSRTRKKKGIRRSVSPLGKITQLPLAFCKQSSDNPSAACIAQRWPARWILIVPSSVTPRCAQLCGSGGTDGRTSTPSVLGWLGPCPSPPPRPGSASTASSSPQQCEAGGGSCPMGPCCVGTGAGCAACRGCTNLQWVIGNSAEAPVWTGQTCRMWDICDVLLPAWPGVTYWDGRRNPEKLQQLLCLHPSQYNALCPNSPCICHLSEVTPRQGCPRD